MSNEPLKTIRKCAVCGKDMYAGEDWAYKRRKTGQRTKWFCSYKCMRAWDAKHDGKNAKVVTVDEVTAAPKEPVSRAVLARTLAKEIQRGGSVIEYMKAEGYKNPWEAYNAVRHYCETKMPELAEVLKPLKDLPKGPPAQTGRPRKYPAKVEKVDKVPEIMHECGNCKHKGKTSHEPPCDECPDPISTRMRAWEPEEDLQPVQCIAHVTPAELEEAIKDMTQRHDNLKVPGAPEAEVQTVEEQDRKIVLKPENIQDTGEQYMKQLFRLYSRENILLIVDKAALDCQKDHRIITMSSSGVKAAMLQNSTVAAENVGIMKLRKRIRKMLGAEDDE